MPSKGISAAASGKSFTAELTLDRDQWAAFRVEILTSNARTPPTHTASPPKAKVFISYSRQDMTFVDRLEAALKARGVEPLIDRSEIYAFEDWWKRIQALTVQADTMVFPLSP